MKIAAIPHKTPSVIPSVLSVRSCAALLPVIGAAVVLAAEFGVVGDAVDAEEPFDLVGFSGCCFCFESKNLSASIHEFSYWLNIATGAELLPPAITATLKPCATEQSLRVTVGALVSL